MATSANAFKEKEDEHVVIRKLSLYSPDKINYSWL